MNWKLSLQTLFVKASACALLLWLSWMRPVTESESGDRSGRQWTNVRTSVASEDYNWIRQRRALLNEIEEANPQLAIAEIVEDPTLPRECCGHLAKRDGRTSKSKLAPTRWQCGATDEEIPRYLGFRISVGFL